MVREHRGYTVMDHKKRKVISRMWWFLAAAAALFLAGCVFLAAFITGGKRQTFDEAMEWQSSKYDTSFYGETEKSDYTVSGDGGYILHVQLLKAPEDAGRYVIITHGYTDNRIGSLKYAQFYLRLGYSCIIYDLRGHGENAKTPTTYALRESKDLALLIEDTRERYPDIKVLGLHGESLGAATTVMVLKYSPQVDFAVADCGFSDIENVLRSALKSAKIPGVLVDMQNIGLKLRYGCSFSDMRPIDALKESDSGIPMLFIHGADDELIPVSNSKDMYEAAKGYKEIHIIEGAKHAVSAIVAPEEYMDILKRFLEEAVSTAD